jgi:tripartite-type tricarboxylate transporter receptor subunit TctC
MIAPAGTPREIVNRLNRSIAVFLKRPDIQERLRNDGREGIAMTPDETAQMLASEIATWRKVVQVAQIKLN